MSEDSKCGKTRPAAVAALIQRERVVGFSFQEKERTSLGRRFDGLDATFPSSVILEATEIYKVVGRWKKGKGLAGWFGPRRCAASSFLERG